LEKKILERNTILKKKKEKEGKGTLMGRDLMKKK